MSKRQFKTSANSARAGAGLGGFGNSGLGFGSAGYSTLSYVQVPPDYGSINDANVVVAFKNLAKKDGTTKAKALEDLQAHLSTSDVEVEDGVLEAWVGRDCTLEEAVNSDNYFLGQTLPTPFH